VTSTVTMHIGDVRDVMAGMDDASIDLIVTSPPFLALRSYLPADHPQKHREIGSEPTPAAYLDTLLELTQTWRRLLTPTGSLAVELGDTYSGSGGDNHLYDTSNRYSDEWNKGNTAGKALPGRTRDITRGWPLPKSLCGIPTLYAWSLTYGRNLLNPDHTFPPWRIRNLLHWTRPNPPVGRLGDKFRPATSFVTVACTSDKRWFDLDAVRTETTVPNAGPLRSRSAGTKDLNMGGDSGTVWATGERMDLNPAGAPPLDWWDETDDWQPLHRLPTHPYKGAHYATFPPQLPRRLIAAMCPREVCTVGDTPEYAALKGAWKWGGDVNGKSRKANPTNPMQDGGAQHVTLGWTDCQHNNFRPGVVLDSFAGSGTTAIAAASVGRDCVLIDLDWRNTALVDDRIRTAMRVTSYKASNPKPRGDQDGRAGRTPTRHHRGYDVPNPGRIRPIATRYTWTVDGTQKPPPQPRPVDHRQLSLAL
jgi:hypothetical protein